MRSCGDPYSSGTVPNDSALWDPMLVLQILNDKYRWTCTGHLENRGRRCENRLEYHQEIQAKKHIRTLSGYHTSSIIASHKGVTDLMITGKKSWNKLLDAMICETHTESFNASIIRELISREWKQAVANWNSCPDDWKQACKMMLLPNPRQAIYDLLGRHQKGLREAVTKDGASGENSQAGCGRDKKRQRLA